MAEQIFVFTAGNPDARAHVRVSIEQPLNLDRLEGIATPDLLRRLREIQAKEGGVYAWGAIEGKMNRPRWESMEAGALVLTVFDAAYHYASRVLFKYAHGATAERIWGTDDAGETWRYMYFLTKPVKVYRRTAELAELGYLAKGYLGFTRISDAKVERVLADFGTLDAFVRDALMGDPIVDRPLIEAELKNVEQRLSDIGAFDATNDEDARERTLRDVVRRRGQAKFRNKLLRAYDGLCAVTGCDFTPALEAAHIVPYLGEQTNHVQNGILLRSDIHTLFDLGELSIDERNHRILLSMRLAASQYGFLDGMTLRLPRIEEERPDREALKTHRKAAGFVS